MKKFKEFFPTETDWNDMITLNDNLKDYQEDNTDYFTNLYKRMFSIYGNYYILQGWLSDEDIEAAKYNFADTLEQIIPAFWPWIQQKSKLDYHSVHPTTYSSTQQTNNANLTIDADNYNSATKQKPSINDEEIAYSKRRGMTKDLTDALANALLFQGWW